MRHSLQRIYRSLAGLLLLAPLALNAQLFEDSDNVGVVDTTDETWIVRKHFVDVDFDVLAPAGTAENATTLELDLFVDVRVTAELDYVVRNPSGSTSWVGRIDGVTSRPVVLVFKDGVLVGSVRDEGAFYQIVHVGNGGHAVYEIDELALPGEEPPTAVSLPEGRFEPIAGTDPSTSYDLQVVYTPVARSNAGGTTAMENWIDLGVTETNDSYTVSGVNTQILLVHTEEVVYTESGSLGTDRERLRIDGDGFIDNVHVLRDEHGADVTTLIVENPGCGIAYIMNPVSPAFEEFAFNVTRRSCVSPNYTFAHEIGHLQSARHDWFVDPTNNAPFTYNHGYVHPGNQWRSIMAYSNDCGGCQRQLFWSNPDRLHPVTGDPTGIPEGQPNAADNRKTLNTTASTVANFRQSVGAIFTDGFESGNTSAWSSTVP